MTRAKLWLCRPTSELSTPWSTEDTEGRGAAQSTDSMLTHHHHLPHTAKKGYHALTLELGQPYLLLLHNLTSLLLQGRSIILPWSPVFDIFSKSRLGSGYHPGSTQLPLVLPESCPVARASPLTDRIDPSKNFRH